MSEEILKALTQLFAIISKQDDGVTDQERAYVIRFFQQELDQDSVREYIEYFDEVSGYNQGTSNEGNRLTSVKDSVRTLGICRKINKTLTQKQKVIVLIRLMEMVGAEKNMTVQAMSIITTVANVFNVDPEQYKLIETFVMADAPDTFHSPDLRVMATDQVAAASGDHATDGRLVFMVIRSVSTYFVKYTGGDPQMLNGFVMQPGRVYLFPHGSSVKLSSGEAVYYSDLVSFFNKDIQSIRLSFNAKIEEFAFDSGGVGLRNVIIAEGPGTLIGIMGASGAGKTTLLNVLAGVEKPGRGTIRINGLDIHSQKEKINGVIGYVAQDDLLIEELTVYENLYFNAKLCFSGHTEEQLYSLVMTMLTNLGLEQRRDLKVGNALDKTISGGQRKRLNIALELIREPAILFLDEPTSGLSSRDSENVIDLLKELSLKGKLIFVVIHQPSSEIYKMFDKMIIMDTGGYPVYYGRPVEAVTYFKSAAHQVDSHRGQCEACANVNPEQIFNIIEARVVDEYGQTTSKRKVTPPQWHDMYQRAFTLPTVERIEEELTHSLRIPGRLQQTIIFATRDLLAKISNRQYLLVNLLEAPLLAAILSFVIRYKNAHDGSAYVFRYNDNLPAFILMSIVVALFMGLTVSAEEIIRDRKILKRESFLDLSRNSYLLSKVTVLFALSAVQTMLFVLVGHFILEIHGMTLAYWFMLFTTSCFANLLGLNISSAFNSAVTVYVIIPLLLIPQMILSGTIFSFDKLNDHISTKGKTPVLADLMTSRWAYEALAVYSFTENEFEKPFFEYEKEQSRADFKAGYLADELDTRARFIRENLKAADDPTRCRLEQNLAIIRHALKGEACAAGIEGLLGESDHAGGNLTDDDMNKIGMVLMDYRETYRQAYDHNLLLQEKKMAYYQEHGWDPDWYKDRYFNQSLSDLVRNVNSVERVTEYGGQLIQLIDPIFQHPSPAHPLDYRAPLFSPEKNLFGVNVSTFTFNALVIWFMCGLLYLTLYTSALRGAIRYFERIRSVSLKLKSTNLEIKNTQK